MQLHLLRATSCLSIYYDSINNWLYLDWAGDLTLPAVQDACVAVAQCYLTRTYLQVLNSHLQVTEIGSSIGTWLSAEFLPYMTLVGVEHIAWVSVPSLVGRKLAQTVVNRMPSLVLNLFDNAEEATVWLRQTRSM